MYLLQAGLKKLWCPSRKARNRKEKKKKRKKKIIVIMIYITLNFHQGALWIGFCVLEEEQWMPSFLPWLSWASQNSGFIDGFLPLVKNCKYDTREMCTAWFLLVPLYAVLLSRQGRAGRWFGFGVHFVYSLA